MSSNIDELQALREELERQRAYSFCLEKERNQAESLASELIIRNAELLKKSVDYITPLKSLEDIRLIKESGDYDKNRRQVLIIGYYGEENYGDELMLDNILKTLRKDDVQIWICLFPSPRYPYQRWKDCRCLYLPKTEEGILDCAVFFDELIVGGGAHIDDIEIRDPGFIPYLARRLSILMLRRRKVVRWIAVSSNREISNTECIKELTSIVREGAQISVRDQLTLASLQKAGIDTSHITLVDDPAFALDINRKTFLIILTGLETKTRLKEIVEDLVDFCAESKDDWELCFVPFLNVRHYDLELIEEVCQDINFKGVEHFIVPEFTDINSMSLYFKAADLVFSMKYHASLLALLFGKPLVTYCPEHRHYFNKMHSLHQRFANDKIIDSSAYSNDLLKQTIVEAVAALKEEQ